MRTAYLTIFSTLLTIFTLISALSYPQSLVQDTTALIKRSPRGGGGRSSFGGGTGRSSTGGGSSRPPPASRGNSNTGGRTSSGSGVSPRYGGFYLGGGKVPYRSGAVARSGHGRPVTPFLLVGGGLGFWAGSGGHWGASGAYVYDFPANVTFKNKTSGKRESLPALCLCQRYLECSCAVNGNDKYVRTVIGDGSYRYLSHHADQVQVVRVNGTETLVLNGTLANGTTASGAAAGGKRGLLESAVWAFGAAGVAWAFWGF